MMPENLPIKNKPYVPSTERLLNLPDVFKGADLTLRFGWDSKRTSHYLYLWKKGRLVAPLGGHSDTFVNLLTTVNRPDWGLATLEAMPSAVIIGIEALRAAGWTTQIMARPEIAVNKQYPVYKIDPYQVVPMSQRQMRVVIEPGTNRDVEGGLPMLHPSWALAEMLYRQGWNACGLQTDDLDPWFETEEDAMDAQTEWDKACQSMSSFRQPTPAVLQAWSEVVQAMKFNQDEQMQAQHSHSQTERSKLLTSPASGMKPARQR